MIGLRQALKAKLATDGQPTHTGPEAKRALRPLSFIKHIHLIKVNSISRNGTPQVIQVKFDHSSLAGHTDRTSNTAKTRHQKAE